MKKTHTLAITLLWLLAYAVTATAQPGCKTVFLPDLGPTEGSQVAEIAIGFTVPPGVTQPVGAFYPVDITTSVEGYAKIHQQVGYAWARDRYFQNVSSISLVFWTTVFEDWMKGNILIRGYTTLPHAGTPAGVSPTWAFREWPRITVAETNMPMSTPIQLGENWNYSIRNTYGFDVQMTSAQIVSRFCAEEIYLPKEGR